MIEEIEKGKIVISGNSFNTADLEWNKHPSFQGVFLKNIVTGSQTDGKFSCHIVKIQAGCEISEHIHQNNWEIHEVIGGDGSGYLADQKICYKAGSTIVIREGQQHKVMAGKQDLYLLAKFIPALS